MTLLHHLGPQVLTPLLTPFLDGAIDIPEFEKSIDRQIIGGVEGVVIGDAIGEGSSLSQAEQALLIETAVARAGLHVGVIAATGTNCTRTTIERSRLAEDLGADALLVTIPYYSKPTLAGVIDHLRQLAAAVTIPIIIDDDPRRTAIDHGCALLDALCDIDLVVGICHGTGRLGYFAGLSSALKTRFQHLSRDDGTAVEFIRLGGHGLVSPIANVIPSPIQTLATASLTARDSPLANAVAEAAASLGQDDVAALKEAMAFIHEAPADMRLPLVPVETAAARRIRAGFTPFVNARSLLNAAA